MKYIWDPVKNEQNLKKHGYSFEQAYLVFEQFHITTYDDRRDYGETRLITLGTIEPYGREVVVAHTNIVGTRRIISMRKANRRERKIFENYLGEHHG